jgi:phosphatidylserine/phosphatidylglycerophosphate/cardiolipin synthase-like enzyme
MKKHSFFITALGAMLFALCAAPALAQPDRPGVGLSLDDLYPGVVTCDVTMGLSPREGTEDLISAELGQATERIWVAMYSLTSPRLVADLIAAHERGIDVRLKLDRRQSSGKGQKAQIRRLQAARVPVTVSRLYRTMHHKFAVIDGRTVITGSYNWTISAEQSNKENAVVLRCEEIALQYELEWDWID